MSKQTTNKGRHRITLQNYLILISIMLAIVLLLITSFILYRNSRAYLLEKLNFIQKVRLNQFSSNINNNLEQAYKVTQYLQESERVKDYIETIEASSTNSYDKVRTAQELSLFLTNIREYNSVIKNINIVTNKAQYSTQESTLDLHLSDHHNSEFEVSFVNRGDTPFSSKILSSNYYLTCDFLDDSKIRGKIFVLLDSNFPRSNILNTDNIAIIDGYGNSLWTGRCLSYTDMDSFANLIKNRDSDVIVSGDHKFYCKNIAFEEWTIVYSDNINFFAQKSRSLLIFSILSLTISIFIAIMLSNIVSRKIISPVVELKYLAEKYSYQDSDNKAEYFFKGANKKQRFSLREKLLGYFIFTVLIPISIYIIMFSFQTNSIIKTQVIDSYISVYGNSLDHIGNFLENKQIILQRIAFDRHLQDHIINKDIENMEESYLLEIIEQNAYLGLERDSISIYDKNKNLVFSNNLYEKSKIDDKLDELLNKSKRAIIWSSEKDFLNRSIISLSMPIISHSQNQYLEVIGYVKLDIDYIYLENLFKELNTDNSEAFILNREEDVSSRPKGSVEPQITNLAQLVEGKENIVDTTNGRYIVYFNRIKNCPWHLMFQYNYNDIIAQSNLVMGDIKYLLIIILLLIIIMSYTVSFSLLKPINKLNTLFSITDLEDLHNTFDDFCYIDEISELGETFNNMLGEIDTLIDKLLSANIIRHQLEQDKKEAELIALQAQINPHFLYNTLDTINYMIRQDKKTEAITMINALSDLFRFGISRKELEITIEEEVKYAKAYSEIMEARYSNNITFIWNIDKTLIDHKTIKLILQPLIENAIYHGVANSPDDGIIRITCKDIGSSIQFIVEDNGAGMSEHELILVTQQLQDKISKEHLGLYNVQSRLHLYYGLEHGLRISSSPNKGTTVIVSIPKYFST